jgi:RND family efflux transporter MFP subunit
MPPRTPWKPIVFSLVILALLGGGVAYRVNEKVAEKAKADKARQSRGGPVATVAAVKAERRDIVNTFEATGTLETPETVKIAPRVTGRIAKVLRNPGAIVKRGDKLVLLDATDVDATIRKARATLAQEAAKLTQVRASLRSTDVSVDGQVTQAQAALNTARADQHQVEKSAEAQKDAAEAAVANAEASVGSAQANLDNAQAKFKRMNELYDSGYISRQAFDDSATALAVQKSAVKLADGQLKSATAARSIVANKAESDIAAAKAKVAQAESTLKSAQAARDAQRGSPRVGRDAAVVGVADSNIQAQQAAVQAARAALDNAVAGRADMTLVAPFDGVVAERFLDAGSLAGPSQPVLSVQVANTVWVSIGVPGEVCAKLKTSDEVQVSFDDTPVRTFAATIAQIEPGADAASRLFTVRAMLDNKAGHFKPGMFARVIVETGRVASVVAVPREAVKTDKDGPCVYVVVKEPKADPAVGDAMPAKPEGATPGKPGGGGPGKPGEKGPAKPDGKAERRAVTTGASDAAFIEIVSGVEPGDLVVTVSSAPLKDGQDLITGGGRGKGAPGDGAPTGKGRPDATRAPGGPKPDGVPGAGAAGSRSSGPKQGQ